MSSQNPPQHKLGRRRSNSLDASSRLIDVGHVDVDPPRNFRNQMPGHLYSTTIVKGAARVQQGDIIHYNTSHTVQNISQPAPQSFISDSAKHLVSGIAGGAIVAVLSSYSSRESLRAASPSRDIASFREQHVPIHDIQLDEPNEARVARTEVSEQDTTLPARPRESNMTGSDLAGEYNKWLQQGNHNPSSLLKTDHEREKATKVPNPKPRSLARDDLASRRGEHDVNVSKGSILQAKPAPVRKDTGVSKLPMSTSRQEQRATRGAVCQSESQRSDGAATTKGTNNHVTAKPVHRRASCTSRGKPNSQYLLSPEQQAAQRRIASNVNPANVKAKTKAKNNQPSFQYVILWWPRERLREYAFRRLLKQFFPDIKNIPVVVSFAHAVDDDTVLC